MAEINVDFRKRPNWLQAKCVELCIERFGIIGTTTFLRCMSCHKIVTADRILQYGDCACGNRTYRETNLTLKEEIYWVGRALVWKILKRS